MEQDTKQFSELSSYIETLKPKIEKALQDHRPQAPSGIETEFDSAMDFVFSSNETPIRPILALLGAELTDESATDVLPSAVAVEFVYLGSRIFEDLPFMSESKSSDAHEPLHKKFGEELATLVGLGFLNSAYPLVFVNHGGTPERAIQGHSEIVECVGAAGLVGGIAANQDNSAGYARFSVIREFERFGVDAPCIAFGCDIVRGGLYRACKSFAFRRATR